MENIIAFMKEHLYLLIAIAAVFAIILIISIISLSKTKKEIDKEQAEKEDEKKEEIIEEPQEEQLEEVEETKEEESEEEEEEIEEVKEEPQEEQPEEIKEVEEEVEEIPELKEEVKEEVEPVKVEEKPQTPKQEPVHNVQPKEEKPEPKKEMKIEPKKEMKIEPKEEIKEEPKEDVKKEVKVEQKEERLEQKTPKYAGKWFIAKKNEKEYNAILKASNGEIILTSETYASPKSVVSGIETMKKNIALNNFQMYTDKKGYFFYKLKDSSNKLLCIGEVYKTRQSCESSIESVKKFAGTAILQEEMITDFATIEYIPEQEDEEDVSTIKVAYRGKWLISTDEDGRFMAQLIASNGEILLNTEKYASRASLDNSIENLKENIKNNNFIIDRDKNNKFYYKLRNEQKLTLCVGETYDKQQSCINAIESVKKFARRAIIKVEEVDNGGDEE